MKKTRYFIGLLAILFAVFTLVACSSQPSDDGFIPDDAVTKIELIDDHNRKLIGKEIRGRAIVMDADEALREKIAQEPIKVEIPENPIIHSVDNMEYLGFSIQEIELNGMKTPELIGPNGAIGVFSKGNAEGFRCKAGNTIIWSFEKYPFKDGLSQTLAVGYVKDGVMYESKVFRDKLSDTYQLAVSEDGVYHIYFLCASSDPISLKEGEIQINRS